MRNLIVLCLSLAVAAPGVCQFEMQSSGTTASLRGIDSLGKGLAWASGTGGTVLRTVDGGKRWEACAMPPDAEKLDFRAVQGLDAKTAVVMSSGTGELSRIYKTVDGCKSWKLVFTNPDKDGFFDALKMNQPLIPMKAGDKSFQGRVVGDPVDGKFAEFDTSDSGDHWERAGSEGYPMPLALPGEGMFAASNASMLFFRNGSDLLVTGGPIGAHTHVLAETIRGGKHTMKYIGGNIPVAGYVPSAGAFAVAIASTGGGAPHVAADDKERVLYVDSGVIVAVGGDYQKPDVAKGTAAYSVDSGVAWKAATTTPHGYRSSVAYDAAAKMWIAVGPNGTDVSTDDGVNWHAVTGDGSGADKDWNALSLPFVVGSKGRIGVLRPEVLVGKK
jgi:hypothetical protein